MTKNMGLLFSGRVTNLYDSHVHWVGTGSKELALDLSHLKSPFDFLKLQTKQVYFRGEWLIGYNWSQSNWTPSNNPTRQILDEYNYKGPIVLLRADRHAAWVNTEALIRAGFFRKWESPDQIQGGVIHLDTDGFPTGYLIDRAMEHVKALIPRETNTQIYEQLKTACRVFNQNGYTHIRDVTCNENQWEQSLLLAKNRDLTLCVEQFFDVDGLQNLEKVLNLANEARQTSPKEIRVKGVKVYYDGALGSEGALLSKPYYGNSNNLGFALYELKALKKIIKKIWEYNFEVAVHVIGDEAAHQVVKVASELYKENTRGRLNLEHAEMLRTETIAYMRNIDVVCQMQPCHWLSDKVWARQKLQDLFQYLFRWNELEKNNIPFYFGSDSPIEPPSLRRNLLAVFDAESEGIESTLNSPIVYMQNSSVDWMPNCYSIIEAGEVVKTVFNNNTVFTRV